MKKLSRRSFGKLALGFATSVVIGGVELRFISSAAAVAQPSISGTAAWGAASPRGTIDIRTMKPTGIIVHHTTNQNTTNYTQAQAFSLARQIQQSHFGRGWIDTGQQFTISRGGYIMEGRHRSLEALTSGTKHVVGAHADGYNISHIGIECEGLYTSVAPTQALYDKLVAMCAYICQQYDLDPSSIKGHRDVNSTSCPGDVLYNMLPQLRNDVAAALGSGPARTWPVVKIGSTNASLVKTIQYFLRAKGNTSVTADGIFGTGTESAVKSFQTANALTADGIVGASTWEKLVMTVRLGDMGDAVRALQTRLIAKGYTVTVDGNFGTGTESAVKSFQSANALTADGIVGINTWNKLIN